MSKNQANGQAKKGKKGKKEKKGINLDDLKQDMVTDVHTITLEELLDRLGTNESTGLTPADAEERLLKDGPNELTPPKTTPEIIKFLKQLSVGFNLLLEIGGILCLIAYLVSFPQYDTWELAPKDNLWLFVVLWVVALLTGTFSYFTEYSSGKVMQSFKKMIPPQATIIRGGSITRVESRNLVVGDLVEVKGGDRLPADIRVISASGFKVDNSSLTGESEPQARSPECTNDNPLETKNLAFFSTNALEGVCRGIVVQTGDRTVMGRIAGLTAGLKDKTTTLRKELNRFVLIITCLACFYGILFFIISMALGYGLLTSVIYLIGIIVANAPEGLLPEVAVALSITAKRLAARSCLVKNLEAVETLGSTSTICSDKTGTLTQNRMTVTHMWFNEEISTAEYLGESRGAYQLLPGWPEYIRVAALCSRAEFREEQENVPVLQRICMGDASESAILKYTEIELGDTKAYRQRYKKVFEIPFNSSNKYQLSVHELPSEDPQSLVYTYVLVMKGAPERIYNRCDSILLNGKQMRLSSDVAEKFDNAYVQLGGLGERVIGLADCLLPMDKFPKGYKFDAEANNFPLEGLRFVGLISMIDPPRPAVPDAVAKCRSAGIRVIMVTGDHPITAEAIARSVGIIGKDSKTLKQICQEEELTPDKVDHTRANAIVVTGTELRDYSSDQLRRVLMSHPEVVFARTSPQQKLIIVEANQNIGAVVAVTGDGVNDSPALKRANIGIAMGIAGSEVTKEAANMVLMDDNFASIVVGIEEGRKIFDNIKKAIGYALTTNIPELVPFLVYIIGGYPLPLATISMLCISIGTDILPAIAFAHEPPESEIMKRKPRRLKDHMVTMKLMNLAYGMYGLLESFCGFYVYFVCYGENGWSLFTTFQLRPRWEATALNDLMDDYGQEWTYAQRLALQQTAQSAYFGAVVLAQWGNLLIFKTRIVTLFKHGMRNTMQVIGLFFETCVAFFVVYAPFINVPFGTAPFPYHFWLAALPYAFLSLFLDEIRKLILRRHPKGWVAEITAY